ncbi:MAG: carbohydrate ABC transporter permease [Candidatus Micrarchaeia archaeon]
MKIKIYKIVKKILIHLILISFSIFVLIPIYWNIITSFKTPVELSRIPPTLIPISPTLDYYTDLLTMRHFAELIRNSIIVSLGNASFSTLIGTLLGYSISKIILSKQKRELLTITVAVFKSFPVLILIIPYYVFINSINLVDTWLGLIIPYLTFGVPFATWTMKGFFDEFPKAMEEAPLIDGCSRISGFFKVTLVILLPSIFVVFIFTFLYSWNEFLYALILTSTYNSQTVTIGVYATVSKWEIAWPKIAAAGVMSALPVLALFILVRKYIVRGIVFGVVKG